jgi:hypothetical protein
VLDTLERMWREDSELLVLVGVVLVTAFLVARWARQSIREGRQRQAVRRVAIVLGAAGVAIAGVAIARGGEDADREYAERRMRELAAEEKQLRDRVVAAIRARRLPPVALEMFPADGEDDGDIIPRPEGDGDQKDVIHAGGDGTSGRKLAWDLDDDGRISRGEREVTEAELWAAAIARAGRAAPGQEREDSGERAPA